MTDHRTQYIALLLVVGAAIVIGFGEWKNWIHLVDFGSSFGGAGLGILTGQKIASVVNKDGGTINATEETK